MPWFFFRARSVRRRPPFFQKVGDEVNGHIQRRVQTQDGILVHPTLHALAEHRPRRGGCSDRMNASPPPGSSAHDAMAASAPAPPSNASNVSENDSLDAP